MFNLVIKSIPAVVLTSLTMLGSAAVYGDDTASCDSLVASGNSEYPPYLWRNPGATDLVGANRVVIDELSRRTGISIALNYTGSWARVQELARSGKIDLIAGAFLTLPRLEYMDYVYPAFLSTTSVVWKKSGTKTEFSSPEDLKGKVITTVINNSFGNEFDEYAARELKIDHVSSLEQSFKMLANKRTDFVIYEKEPGLALAKEMELNDQIEPLSPAISAEGLYLTISHASACNTGKVRGALATAMNQMIEEGFMQTALEEGTRDWEMRAK